MNAYGQGFLHKCAEMGVGEELASSLLKLSEGKDPNLDRAVELFKDYLENRRYTVRDGETLSGIASRSGTDLGTLMEANGMNSPFVRPGQTVKIPIGGKGRKGSKDGIQVQGTSVLR